MDVIYTDAQLNELGVLRDFSLDVDVAKDMDFEIKLPTDSNVLSVGGYWLIEGTEYGGRLDCIKVATASDEVIYTGRTWRGMLGTKIICPPDGEDYRYANGGWQPMAAGYFDELGLSDLFEADNSDFWIKNWKIDRYVTLLDALNKMLASDDYRISLEWRQGRVHVGAVKTRDLTDSVQYETDDRVNLTVTDNRGGVNHLICLGQGDLAEREVVHLYTTQTGAITELAQYYTGLDEIVEVYEDTGAETREDLKQGGFERLKERRNSRSFSVDVEDMDIRIGDVVGGVERVTGIRATAAVTNIIFKIDRNGQIKIEYKVGESE